ncbi:MAG: hypothetical protein PHE54_05265 [Bacilli bacterium]|nr:hypothetical protein [Bacilli bacterium]
MKTIITYLLNLILMVFLVIISLLISYQLVVNKTFFKEILSDINYNSKASEIIKEEMKDYVRDEIVSKIDVDTIVSESTNIVINDFFNRSSNIDKEKVKTYISATVQTNLQTYFTKEDLEVSDDAINATVDTLTEQIYNKFFPISEFALIEPKVNQIDHYLLYIEAIIIGLIFTVILTTYLINKNIYSIIKSLLASIASIALIILTIKLNDFYYMNSHTALLLNNLINGFVNNMLILVACYSLLVIMFILLLKSKLFVEKKK